MSKITTEMRTKLREPLPPEAVSPHPTKTYLSTIKSIYVAERINDVFGVGSWTLKGEPIEMGEKNIVMKVVLEIPDYDFYGEAYGGNDNADRGDAFKGAVTDGLTKIAAQQLEIGIDVFKGLSTGKKTPDKVFDKTGHYCKEHGVVFFRKGAMKSYAHPIGDTGVWCHEPKPFEDRTSEIDEVKETPTPTPKPAQKATTEPKEQVDEGGDVDKLYSWIAENMKWKSSASSRSWIVNKCKIGMGRIDSEPLEVKKEVSELMGWSL